MTLRAHLARLNRLARLARRVCLLFLIGGAAGAAQAQLIDGVAAIVDKEVILLSELNTTATLTLERLERQGDGPIPPDVVRQVYHEALQSLIDSKLIELHAKRFDLAASDEEIDFAVDSIAQDEGVTAAQVYGAAAEQGLARADYRRELSRQITRMKVISGSVRTRITVSDAEIQALFDERYRNQPAGLRARVRHILLPWPAELDAEQRQRFNEIAEQIRTRAIETGDFAGLALQYSRAPTAPDGGLTTFRQGEVTPAIGAQVFSLPPGEITPIVETEHGLNIFQVLNRFDPAEITLEDVEDSLRAELTERKTQPAFETWVEGLRKNRYIEIVKAELRR